jgi:putative ABC transport system permease protein
MQELLADLRFALRAMRKSSGFTAVAVLTLAIAIGANTAIFSFVDAVLLKPLPYPEPDRLALISERPPSGGRNAVSSLNFLDWKAQNSVFSHIAATGGDSFTMSGGGEPQMLNAQLVSASFFDVMGLKPAIGRGFLPDEDQPGKEQVIVLTHKAWEKHFGGDPRVAGRTITLNDRSFTVVGVTPPGVYDRSWNDIFAPLAFTPDRLTRDFHWMGVRGRLKPGVTVQQAQAEMEGIAKRIAEQYPAIKKGWSATVDVFVDRVVAPSLRQSLWVMLAAVGAVLLIGCVNLANLTTARGADRVKELAVRTAMGAGRGRLIRQLLTESVLTAVAGAAGGVVLGYALMRWILLAAPPFSLPAQADVRFDWRIFLFTAAIAIATGLLFGIAPALKATRGSAVESLKEGGRGSTTGVERHRLRNALIVAEVALAFILLTGAGLLLRSFQRTLGVDAGFDSTNVITMGLPAVMGRDTDGARLTGYYHRVEESIAGVPGVRDVSLTSALPLRGWGFGMPFHIAGRPDPGRSARPACFFKIVTPSYFRTLGVRLQRGRALTPADVAGAAPVAVINEEMARRYFDKEDPIGKRILVQQIVTGKRELGPEIPWEVVGIAGNEKTNSLNVADSVGMYVPLAQSPIVGMAIVVRGAADPQRLVKAIQASVWSVNKNQALTDVRTLETIKSDSLGSNRLRTTLLGVFAAIAMALAAVGIYGVLSYSVAQRTHELGIRAALGAGTGDLMRLVVGGGMALAAIGVALGALGAIGLTRYLSTLLFQTEPTDPPTMIAVGASLLVVAFAACVAPALRATRVDPVVALRLE